MPLPKPTSMRSLIAGIAAFLVVVAVTQAIAISSDRTERSRQAQTALTVVSELRSNLELRINNLLLSARGLRAYVELHGTIGQPEFERFAHTLIGDNPLVVNVALTRGSVIDKVYPFERNKAVLGIDVLSIEGHRTPYERMKSTGLPILVGPINVRQGVLAFIGRVPIYRRDVVNTDEKGKFWGSTAMVIDAKKLFESSRLQEQRGNFMFALRGSDGQGSAGTTFFGDADVFNQEPKLQSIHLPGEESWELAIVPVNGWISKSRIRVFATVLGYLVALIVGLLTYLLFRKQEQVQHLALHDSLSGLPNRRLFFDRLDQASSASERYGRKFALLLIDLDGFKPINDNFGHPAGDEVIRRTADRLNSSIRRGDTAARLGGDEFVVLLENADYDQANLIAEKLRIEIAMPLQFENQTLQVSASIGIALAPDHGNLAEELVNQADAALYSAKDSGKNAIVVANQDTPTPNLN